MTLTYLERAAAYFEPPVRHEAPDLMRAAGMIPDDWQAELMQAHPERALLLCSRQAGKSLTVAAIALEEALSNPESTTLVVSPSQRQSAELLGKVRALALAQPTPIAMEALSVLSMRLTNGSRIVSLPGRAEVIRGYTANLLITDEAAWVSDRLYESLRPMLAVSHGRLIALSTPFGRRGWFYQLGWEVNRGFASKSLHTRSPESPRTSSRKSVARCPPVFSPPSTSASSRTLWQVSSPPKTSWTP